MAISAPPSAIHGFKTVVSNLRSLLDVIEREVSATIEDRNPNSISPKLAARPSEALLVSLRKFGQASDELASYAADPSDHVVAISGGFHESNALRVASEFGVADALGEKGLPLVELAKKVDADPVRLRQCLRLLVNREIFRETSFGSDHFLNNRLSSILLSTHEKNLNGFIGHWNDDAYRAGVSIVEAVKSSGASKPPFDHYFGKSLWEFYHTPEGAHSRQRLNQAMIGAEPVLHGGLVYDYDWPQHGEQTTIIDVGGGVGGAAIQLARRYPKFNFVIQDKASVLEDAPKFWQDNAPECASRVTFMSHDFFTAQPTITTAAAKVYFLRFVLHDWQDDDCVRILKPIRDAIAASKDNASRLYVADAVLDENSERFKYMVSQQMMTLLGALERNEIQFRDILSRAGFTIEKIWRNRGFTALIECSVA